MTEVAENVTFGEFGSTSFRIAGDTARIVSLRVQGVDPADYQRLSALVFDLKNANFALCIERGHGISSAADRGISTFRTTPASSDNLRWRASLKTSEIQKRSVSMLAEYIGR